MRRRNKRILIWIFLVIFFLIILYNYNNNFKIKIDSSISNIKEKFLKSSTPIVDNYCKENIIEDKFIVYDNNQLISDIDREAWELGIVYLQPPKWKDGTYFSLSSTGSGLEWSNPYDCRIGEFEGENQNYLYCFNIGYSKEIRDIDKEGNILDIQNYNYRINLTIDLANSLDSEIIPRVDMYGATKYFELKTYPVINYECKKLK